MNPKTLTRWTLTVQLGEGGRKIATESLSFSTRDHAVNAIARIGNGTILRAQEIYTIENEDGEQISFQGSRYISHSLKQVTSFDSETYDLPF